MAYPTFRANRSEAFADRREAGIELASRLPHYRGRNDVVVLALPRGAVPVAFEIAEWDGLGRPARPGLKAALRI